MTAVENIEQKFDMFLDWIFDRHPKAIEFTVADMYKAIEDAKAIEKQQIIDTFKHAQVLHALGNDTRDEQYYNETYKTKSE